MLDRTGTLTEFEAKQVLREAGVPVVDGEVVDDVDAAVAAAEELGFPVMLKVDSRDVQHKTDIEAVTAAYDADEVGKRYDRIMENVEEAVPDADVDGVLVEELVSGHELIVGVNVDPDFGHVLMFGLGGVLVEILHDVNFRAIPVTEQDAQELIDEMETRELLQGVRGQDPVDRDEIVAVLQAVSRLVEEYPRIQELDINPLFASGERVVAADALIRVSDDE